MAQVAAVPGAATLLAVRPGVEPLGGPRLTQDGLVVEWDPSAPVAGRLRLWSALDLLREIDDVAVRPEPGVPAGAVLDALLVRPRPDRGVVLVADGGAELDAVRRAAVGVVAARRLVDLPASQCRPPELADRLVDLFAGTAVTVEVHDQHWLREQGCGGVLGVGQGSGAPPRMVHLQRPGRPGGRRVGLVGKGITFDSGGLSIKPWEAMYGQHTDMAGAAACAGALLALAAQPAGVHVDAWLPLAENMIGPDALRPGDVLRMRAGRSVEVVNTDAEGRLVLADGLALAAESRPDVLLDTATLTGTMRPALGRHFTGLFCSDEALAQQVLQAADEVGEPTWRLPLAPGYRSLLGSPVADLRHTNPADRDAGAIVAALFLQQFTAGIPWAHLDIAASGRESASPTGGLRGSGTPVRTLVRLLEGQA